MERVVHIDDEGVVELCEDLPLIHDRLDAALSDDSGLRHLLHGVVLLCLLPFDLPDLSEAAFSDAIHIVEVGLSKSCINHYRKS